MTCCASLSNADSVRRQAPRRVLVLAELLRPDGHSRAEPWVNSPEGLEAVAAPCDRRPFRVVGSRFLHDVELWCRHAQRDPRAGQTGLLAEFGDAPLQDWRAGRGWRSVQTYGVTAQSPGMIIGKHELRLGKSDAPRQRCPCDDEESEYGHHVK